MQFIHFYKPGLRQFCCVSHLATNIKFADNTGSYDDARYVRINFVKKSHSKLHMQKSVIVGHFISIVMVSLRVSMDSQDSLH